MTESRTVTQIEIDRLVDGELDERQERHLLARLDQSSDGWRRCALAFLEARTWQRELRRLVEPDQTELAKPTASHGQLKPRRPAMALAALCAGWLLAFGLGAGLVWLVTARSGPEVRSFRAPAVAQRELPRPADVQPAAETGRSVTGPTARARAEVTEPARSTAEQPKPAARRHTPAGPDHARPPAAAQSAEPSRPSESGQPSRPAEPDDHDSLRLLVQHSSGETEVLNVPVVDVLNAEELWRAQQRTAAERLRKRLEQLGHRVRTQRWLIPVPLRDGRQLVLPVEELDVQPTRFVSYQ